MIGRGAVRQLGAIGTTGSPDPMTGKQTDFIGFIIFGDKKRRKERERERK